jgi:uncharacterized protein
MKKTILNSVKVIVILYTIICILLYFFQEKLIFFPEKIAKDYQFQFNQKFEELNFKTDDDKLLNGILFKADSSKGLIFYLHGNAGSLKGWGEIAQTYTSLNYDLFMLDYRSYGKSEGEISSEKQFYNDVQLVYDILKKKYPENKIIILGYSIGTGPATKLASTNNAKLLILQAPYYSLTDMMHNNYPFVPKFILKYKFETNKFIKQCKMPVVIFHGNTDEVIYYNSSVKLKTLFKKNDTLITLNGQGHNNMSENPEYQEEIQRLLNKIP